MAECGCGCAVSLGCGLRKEGAAKDGGASTGKTTDSKRRSLLKESQAPEAKRVDKEKARDRSSHGTWENRGFLSALKVSRSDCLAPLASPPACRPAQAFRTLSAPLDPMKKSDSDFPEFFFPTKMRGTNDDGGGNFPATHGPPPSLREAASEPSQVCRSRGTTLAVPGSKQIKTTRFGLAG